MVIEEFQTWRDLSQHLDKREKQRIVQALGIQQKTLRRWISGQTASPHLHTLQQLASLLPLSVRTRFILLLQQDPALAQDAIKAILPGLPDFLPAALYERVLQTYVTTPAPVRCATICQLLFHQALNVFDPDRQGMYMALFLCTPPAEGGIVRSLRLEYSMETTQWKEETGNVTLFLLGSESIAGQAVIHRRLCTNEDTAVHEDLILQTRGWDPARASIVAAPIMRAQELAGALVLVSAQPHALTPQHLALVRQCSHLLVLAINNAAWYPFERIVLLSRQM